MSITDNDITQTEIDSAKRIVTVYGLRKKSKKNEDGKKPFWHFEYTTRLYLLLTIIPFLLAIFFAVISNFYPWVKILAYASLALEYLGIMLYPVFMGVHYWREIKHTSRYPMSTIISNIDDTLSNDLKYFNLLCKKREPVLTYILTHMKAERDYFEKRGLLIVGSLEKTGIILGLIALVLVASKLNSPEYGWLDAVIYSVPVLYLMGIIAQAMLHKLDRMISIVELAIKTVGDKNKEDSEE